MRYGNARARCRDRRARGFGCAVNCGGDGLAKERLEKPVGIGGGMDTVGGEAGAVITTVVGERGVDVEERVVILTGQGFERVVQGADLILSGEGGRHELAGRRRAGRWDGDQDDLDVVLTSGLSHAGKIIFNGWDRRPCEVVDAAEDYDHARAELGDVVIKAREHVNCGVAGKTVVDDLQAGDMAGGLERGPSGNDRIADKDDAGFAAGLLTRAGGEHRGCGDQDQQLAAGK